MEENKNVENVEETTENNEQKEENVEETTEKSEGENKEEAKEKKPNKVAAWFKNTWNTIYNKLGLKKLLIISYIALGVIVVALIISVSCVGAKHSDLKKQSSTSGTTTTTSYSSKEENLFTEWKKGINTSIDYFGPLTATATQTVKYTKDSTVYKTTNREEKEIVLSDGQYAYDDSIKEVEYKTDGSKEEEEDTNEYTIIKNDNGKYGLYSNDSSYLYTVDDKYYNRYKGNLELYLNISSNAPAFIAAEAEKLEDVSTKIMSYYYLMPYFIVSDWNTTISKDDDGITVSFTYKITYMQDDCYMVYDQSESYTINGDKISKAYGKTIVNIDNLNDVDEVQELEKTYTFAYSSTTEDFNSIVSGKTVPTNTSYRDADVEYYVNGALYNTLACEIGGKMGVFPLTGAFEWYTDEACTQKCDAQVVVPGNGLKLYAKEISNGDGFLVFIQNISYKYASVVPNCFKQEDTKKASAITTDEGVDYADIINSQFSNYAGKLIMDGKEYTLDELKAYNFESGKVYYIDYYTSRNGMYA
jgi:hypothetical protein